MFKDLGLGRWWTTLPPKEGRSRRVSSGNRVTRILCRRVIIIFIVQRLATLLLDFVVREATATLLVDDRIGGLMAWLVSSTSWPRESCEAAN